MVKSVYPFVKGKIVEVGSGELHPKLSCSDGPKREATINRLLQNFQEAETFIDSITNLLRERLCIDASCVNFIRSNCVNIQQACGTEAGANYDAPGLCFWTLVPDHPQVLIIEDLLEDARTSESPLVSSYPFVRSYAAAPLVTSGQQRIGTLCLLHSKPRVFSLEEAAVLCNLAELVICTLEDLAASDNIKPSKWAQRGYAILEMRDERLTILGANHSIWALTGTSVEGPCDFEQAFSSSSEVKDAIKALHTGKASSAASLKLAVEGNTISASIMSAAALAVESLRQIAIPARRFMDEQAHSGSSTFQDIYIMSTTPKITPRKHRLPSALGNLQLQYLLGTGSFSRVYRGRMGIQKTAVKIVHDLSETPFVDGQPTEASSMLQHRNIVQVFQSYLAKNAIGEPRFWLILEFCDMGNFNDALDRGAFLEHMGPSSVICEKTIAWTAREVARALYCLHKNGILHCDVSGGNVLLQSSVSTPHGFTAKLADFGLARQIEGPHTLKVSGTYTHTAAEVLSGGEVSTASEVYSFGVLLFEMLSSRRAWGGLNILQVHYAMVEQRLQLQWDDNIPATGLRLLATQCMSYEPSSRPSLACALVQLEAICESKT